MGWLSALGGIAKLASKIFGFVLMRKAVQADVMKEQLEDIRVADEGKKNITAPSTAEKRKRFRKFRRK